MYPEPRDAAVAAIRCSVSEETNQESPVLNIGVEAGCISTNGFGSYDQVRENSRPGQALCYRNVHFCVRVDLIRVVAVCLRLRTE